MGQYWKLANLDKREFINPHTLGVGLKQAEQIFSTPSTPQALWAALAVQMPSGVRGGGDIEPHEWIGRWAGDRVVVVGDYTETSDLSITDFDIGEVYGLCSSAETEFSFKDVSDIAARWIEQAYNGKFDGDNAWREFQPHDGSKPTTALAPDMVLAVSKD